MQFWLAPLHGITNYHFRNCLLRHTGVMTTAITPFLPVQELKKLNVRKWNDVLPENNIGYTIIPQLIGNIPPHFTDTIFELQQLGYQRFNWNVGCPSLQVVRKQRGCGLMPLPEKVEAVVKKVVKNTNCRFSLKIRLGMYETTESIEIVKRLNDYPLDFIAVHPRLGVQQYEGTPDWDFYQQLSELSVNQIIYSGDIFNVSIYEQLRQRFPDLKVCLLGRGILRNIFLAEELSGQGNSSNEVRLQRFIDFYNDLCNTLLSYRSPYGTLAEMKELWHYFAVFFSIPSEELQKILRITDWQQFDDYVRRHYFCD